MASPITEYKDRILNLLLHNGYIQQAFPDMQFKDKGNKWISPFHLLNGEKGSPDQSYIHKNGSTLCDNNGDKEPVIDTYMRRNGRDFPTALRELGRICGIESDYPSYDNEKAQAYKDAQQKRREANSRFISALWGGSKEANRVLEYMRSRNWTAEEIKKAEIGYADTDLLASLPYSDTHSEQDGHENRLIGTEYRLTIPYRVGSDIYGFKFRDIDHASKEAQAEKQGQEYKLPKYFNTFGSPKNGGFFSVPRSCPDLVIVEGELDALHAKVRGYKNIVATAGGAATTSQVQDAIKRGVRRFTLLLDNDEAGQRFIMPSLTNIEEKGGEVFIAYLPDEAKDTDEYLCSHTLEEWEAFVKDAQPSYAYQFQEIANKYIKLQEAQGGSLSMKQREDFFSEVEKLMNSAPMQARPYNRQLLKEIVREYETSLIFKLSDFEEWVDKAFYREQAKKRKAELQAAATQVNDLLSQGKTDEAAEAMRTAAAKANSTDKENGFIRDFAPIREGDFDRYLSEIQEGIPTGIVFQDGKNKTALTLNAGLTFICGYRGHGKTSFLNNIALNEATRNIRLHTGKSVLYFSYEVEKRRLIADLLNTFVNDPDIQQNSPIDAILSYFRRSDDKGKWFNHGRRTDGKLHIDYFEERLREFRKDYIGSGSLVIVDENYKVGRLLEGIAYYLTRYTPSIICIDYAQLLYSEDFSRQRTEEIKKVVNDIKDFANKRGIPFVLAAQFNRYVESPVSVDTKNIGEGGDFERIADTCIGLFNLKELHPLPNAKDEEREAKKLIGRLMGATCSELTSAPNKLFVRLMKRRYGYYPLDTLLDWEGKTKKIGLNDEEALFPKPEQEELFPSANDEPSPF